MVEASWGDAARDSMTAQEKFRRLEIEAMNEETRVANVLARSRPGISEENYWNQQASTLADRYADTYGGKAIRTSGGNHVEASSPYGQGWTDADGTKWLPEVTVTTNRGDGTYGIDNGGYDTWRLPAMPDNSPLQVVGESPDGGLIWNTDAVSYPVATPDIEVRPLRDAAAMGSIRPIGPVEGFLTFNPLGRTIVGVGEGLNNTVAGLVESGKQTVLTVNDAINYGWSRLDNAVGGDFAYGPQSTLGRSIQAQGAGTIALNMVGGIVQGTVGTALQPLNALYRQDALMFGESLPGAALIVAPLMRGGAMSLPGSARVESEISALQRIGASNSFNAASSVRMARIDELATANYNRLLTSDLGNSNYAYRAVNRDMIDIYEAQGRIAGRGGSPTYFSLDVGVTPFEHMRGAQMPNPPQVMLKIPTNAILGPEVPRPNWGTANLGREYFTNSYPVWGRGGFRQFVGTTEGFSRSWIMPGWGAQ